MTYNLEVEPFGNIEVTENVRSRRITLKIYADKLRVSVPPRTQPKAIVMFFSKYADAIKKALDRAEKKRGTLPKNIIFKPGTEFHTRQRELAFEIQPASEGVTARITQTKMTVYYTAETDMDREQFQKFVHKVIDAALKNEAMKYLPQRTAALAAKHGLKFDHVDLRNMTSQWGSCSTKGRICLNIQLMRLPDELIDLVILHELTHTLHMDHSKDFYADLNRFLGGRHDELEKQIKKLSTRY